MPGENLHKLSKSELNQLRGIVRKVYGKEEGLTDEMVKQFLTSRVASCPRRSSLCRPGL